VSRRRATTCAPYPLYDQPPDTAFFPNRNRSIVAPPPSLLLADHGVARSIESIPAHSDTFSSGACWLVPFFGDCEIEALQLERFPGLAQVAASAASPVSLEQETARVL
jgi:hypothetical protein